MTTLLLLSYAAVYQGLIIALLQYQRKKPHLLLLFPLDQFIPQGFRLWPIIERTLRNGPNIDCTVITGYYTRNGSSDNPPVLSSRLGIGPSGQLVNFLDSFPILPMLVSPPPSWCLSVEATQKQTCFNTKALFCTIPQRLVKKWHSDHSRRLQFRWLGGGGGWAELGTTQIFLCVTDPSALYSKMPLLFSVAALLSISAPPSITTNFTPASIRGFELGGGSGLTKLLETQPLVLSYAPSTSS